MSEIRPLEDDLALWMSNTVTKRLLMQAEEEISSINMSVITGELSFERYQYLCGRIAGLRLVEDFIINIRREREKR